MYHEYEKKKYKSINSKCAKKERMMRYEFHIFSLFFSVAKTLIIKLIINDDNNDDGNNQTKQNRVLFYSKKMLNFRRRKIMFVL